MLERWQLPVAVSTPPAGGSPGVPVSPTAPEGDTGCATCAGHVLHSGCVTCHPYGSRCGRRGVTERVSPAQRVPLAAAVPAAMLGVSRGTGAGAVLGGVGAGVAAYGEVPAVRGAGRGVLHPGVR